MGSLERLGAKAADRCPSAEGKMSGDSTGTMTMTTLD